MVEWFRCLADVPGIDYISDSQIQRSRLPGHDVIPERISYTFEGERREELRWPVANGSTSASPATAYSAASSWDAMTSSQTVVRRLHETLELPGTVSDYHFAVQQCIEALWRRRWQEPAVLTVVEQLCWLDIRLIEGWPETIISPRKGRPTFFHVLAFGHLVELYSQEGFLHEALEVAERGANLNQTLPVAELRNRLACVEVEAP